MNLKIVYGFQHVPKIIAFDLCPLDLVKSNFHGLHIFNKNDVISSKILPSCKTEAVEDRDVTFN